MRGHIRVALMGTDTRAAKIKHGKGLNVTFNRNGNFALLVTRTGANLKQKKVVSLDRVPASYRREFVEMYPPEQQQAPLVNLNISNPSAYLNPPQNPNQAPYQNQAPAIPRGRFCMNCGAEVPPSAAFCPACGQRA